MTRSLRSVLFGLVFISVSNARGQEPVRPAAPAKAAEELKPPSPVAPQPKKAGELQGISNHPDEIKPLPLVAIPDDPPPHEGAMFDIPITVEPPDILEIEVLETLPGRPITGEHLVKPNGTISLGFYGDVYVRGLTEKQVKAKVTLHLKTFMDDEILGLIQFAPDQSPFEPGVGTEEEPGGANHPFGLQPNPGRIFLPEVVPPGFFDKPVPDPKPADVPKGANSSIKFVPRVASRSPVTVEVQDKKRADRPMRLTSSKTKSKDDPEPQDPNPLPEIPPLNVVKAERHLSQFIQIVPEDTTRVFVNINAFNSKSYYMQGDIGVPGRLPWTGNDTVLDALNYAGGLLPSADRENIHLYRPARGGKPRTVYKIDHTAILKGDATANLQLFPGDRVVIGRDPIYEVRGNRE